MNKDQLTIPLVKHNKTKRKPDLRIRVFTENGLQRNVNSYSNIKVSVAGKTIIIYGDGRIEQK